MNSGIYVGVAVAAEQGVLGVSLRDCRDRSVVGISKAGKEVAQRAQSGVMRDEDYTKNAFSINNMGMFEVDGFSAIIYSSPSRGHRCGHGAQAPGHAGRPDNYGQVMKATLSTDKRAADGA
jgi:pyruvate dehydrogenase E2 component (dihydrolipoamide acetyltransferase)